MNERGNFPKAVCISDLHFSLSTLDLASNALKQAMSKAKELNVPLVIAGDLTDQKAIIRAEVANRLISIFRDQEKPYLEVEDIYIIVGNHDMINEKGQDHALHFLEPYAQIIAFPYESRKIGTWLIPYQNNSDNLQNILKDIPKKSTIIMHQGVLGADMGHYIKDSTSLYKEAFADFRVISGHYHKAQDIKCGRPRKGAVGLFSYIGTPYTVSFAEANDGPKGFRVLRSDGTLESVPTNLRRHILIEKVYDNGWPEPSKKLDITKEDLLWLKLKGPKSIMDKIRKSHLGAALPMGENFKLDKIPTESPKDTQERKELKDTELLDKIIDGVNDSETQKKALKKLWRELLETS